MWDRAPRLLCGGSAHKRLHRRGTPDAAPSQGGTLLVGQSQRSTQAVRLHQVLGHRLVFASLSGRMSVLLCHAGKFAERFIFDLTPGEKLGILIHSKNRSMLCP